MTKRLFSKAGISLERLRTFAEVVAASGISSAAPGDPNRQSQFSRQLKELEEFFGAELLRRGRGQFELTAAGSELFRIVQSHFDALEDLADRCCRQNVEVRIGAGESLLQWLFLPNFAEFRSRHPMVTPVLQNLQTEEIMQRLNDGRVDIGLVRLDSVRTPLKSARLGAIEYRVVAPRRNLKQAGEKAAWEMLGRHPLALLSGSEIAAAVEGEAKKRGVSLRVCLRGSSYGQLIEVVRQIGCAAILPLSAIQLLDATFEARSLSALKPFSRTIALAWNPRTCSLRSTVSTTIETLTDSLSGAMSIGSE